MKWSNLANLTFLAYLASMSAQAQPGDMPVTPSYVVQQGVAPASDDNMTIEDTGGSLKIVPKSQQSNGSSQAESDQTTPSSSQGTSGQPSADSVDMNPNPPQDELQEPSNSNQNMVPAGPQQNSMPNPDQGSLQN